jgi:hypothetical protein
MSLEKIMHLALRTITSFSIALALVACSNDNDSSDNTASIDGWVGSQNFDSAQVVVNQIAESGQVAVDINGIYSGFRESTDDGSKFEASINTSESTLLIARGQIADVDRDNNNPATRQTCQLIAGCSVEQNSHAFGEYFPATSGFEWRTIIFNADDGSRNNVNAITTMAEAFAYEYDVQNNEYRNQVYTAYDIVLANSQLSNLLEVTEIVGDLPANLTLLKYLNANYAGISNQIRYGALLGGLQELELAYQANHNALTDDLFITKVAQEYANDKGQLFYRTEAEERELTLEALYRIAHANLLAIAPTITNNDIKVLVEIEVQKLDENLQYALAQPVDTTTTAQADELSKLLTEDELSGISLGLEKTKLFVNSIIDFQNTFWEDDYKQELDAYIAMLKVIGDDNQDNLNALVAEFALIQDYYVTCIIGGRECATDRFIDLELRKTSYDSTTKILVLDGGELTVSQVLANLAVTSTDAVTESNAVDILMVGTLKKNDLLLTLNHTFNDDAETEINVPSSMRIFYPDIVAEVPQDEAVIEGYEIIWADFQLYDTAAVGTDTETDLSGAFRIFYRGVRDPQNTDVPNSSELRFNIENWVLSSLISDTVAEGATAGDISSLIITAQASNPSLYYPSKELASFDGFFTPNNEYNVGDVEAGLLTYRVGTEIVNFESQSFEVETIDFLNSLGEDIRYRFYPDALIEDENDSNGNGDVEEFVVIHLIEECELDKGTEAVVECGPRSRIYAERDLQATINDLWKLGVFQRTTVDGRGSYFVDFPTVKDAENCLVLDTLVGTKALDGELLEQQVLGLDSVRLFSEVSLQNDEEVALPKTLFDITIIAPTENKYKINAALSHNYTGTTADSTSDSEVILGTGTNTNVVRISYDTSADFEDAGNFSVFQGGVELTLDDGTGVIENQDITAFLSQTYDPDSIDYKVIENEEGIAERCVLSVGEIYQKELADVDQVFYLNYRNVIYGTARPEGDQGIWTIRYIDGTWQIPVTDDNG